MVQIGTAMRRTMTATTMTISSSLTSATATRTKVAAATKRIVVRSAMTQLKYRRRRRLACPSCPLANFPSAQTVRRAAAAAAVSIGRNWTTRRRKRRTGPPDLSAPCLAVEAPAWAANVGHPRYEDFHFWTVLRIRIRIRIHMFLGLPDPDPLVRGMDPDPDPSIIMQK